MEIVGTPASRVWESDDKSHAVYRARLAGDDSLVTVCGPGSLVPPLRCAVELRFAGEWQDHPKHGRQFRYATYVPTSPVDRHGMIVYLSQMLDQVGPMRAGKLWDRYGVGAIDVLITDPQQAVIDEILLPAVAQAASIKLREGRETGPVKLELTSLLAGRGFQLSKVICESITRWGRRAAHIVRRSPYALLLANITSAGFKRCDKLYTDLELPPASLKRQALCAEWYFTQSGDGSTWHDARKVIAFVEQHVGRSKADGVRACQLAVRARRLAIRRVGDERWLALAAHARDEQATAKRVEELRSWTSAKGLNSVKSVYTLAGQAI